MIRQKGIIKLLRLRYTIKYKQESSNSMVDALSRREQVNIATEVLYIVTHQLPHGFPSGARPLQKKGW